MGAIMEAKMVQMTFFDHDESYRLNSRIEELAKEVTNCRRGLFQRYAKLEYDMLELQRMIASRDAVIDRLLIREVKPSQPELAMAK
jgi:hypothetical protein